VQVWGWGLRFEKQIDSAADGLISGGTGSFHAGVDRVVTPNRRGQGPVFSSLLALLVLTAMGPPRCCPQAQMNAPPPAVRGRSVEEYGNGQGGVLDLYQMWLSPLKGNNRCPMYPSCSQYAKIGFERFNPLEAYVVSCDRLMRCGHELWMYDEVMVDGLLRWHDPPREK